MAAGRGVAWYELFIELALARRSGLEGGEDGGCA